MTRASREELRLRAVSQLRQSGRFASKNPQPEVVPIPVKQRVQAHLWGKIPTQAMLVLREQPDKTVRVYSALCTLLQGSARTIQVAEIAYLSLLKDRAAREHLKRLKEVGLIDYKASMHGPSIFWLTTPCATKECTENSSAEVQIQALNANKQPKLRSGGGCLPNRSGGQVPPNKNKNSKKKSLTQEKRGSGIPNSQRPGTLLDTATPERLRRGEGGDSNNFKDLSKDSLVDGYLLEREEFQNQKKQFEDVCQQVSQEIESKGTEIANNLSVEKAVIDGKIPSWWVELIDFLPVSKTSQSILMEAIPRERSEISISLSMPRFFAGLAKQRQDDLEAAFSQLHKRDISLIISADKSEDEVSISDIRSKSLSQKPDLSQVHQIALKRLGWKTEPKFEKLECIERYGKQASDVIELAKKVGNGYSKEILEKWIEYPVDAVIRLVEFEKEKSNTNDPVRNYKHWWQNTLFGIVEKQKEACLRA